MHYEFTSAAAESPHVIADWRANDNYHYQVSIIAKDGSVIMPFVKIEGCRVGEVCVYNGYLNEDDISDYVVVTWNGGCGLGFEIFFVTFILSDHGGFTAHTLPCFDPSPEDFLALEKEDRPVFIHSMFIHGEEGKDGKVHNYWVYNLLRFSGTDIVSANSKLAGFPKWIWYKFKPNHQDTDQLTAAQRKRLWLEEWREDSDIWSRDMFPNAETLADEQGVQYK